MILLSRKKNSKFNIKNNIITNKYEENNINIRNILIIGGEPKNKQIKINNNRQNRKILTITYSLKYYLLKNKINFLFNIFLNIYFFISFNYFVCSKTIYLRKLEKLSEISILIKGTGDQQIFYSRFTYPTTVIINGKIQSEVEYKYSLSEQNNNVTMIWNSNLRDCSNMFLDCENIIKIDFSKFNTSEVVKMNDMFNDCKSLTYINFNNFDTSRVTSMSGMFYSCESLTSLDLSKFDTSLVNSMMNMFYGCEKLVSLNLNNFDTSIVSDMSSMFEGCESIILLNISNFNTTKVKTMNSMFKECSTLISLNLNNFETSSLSTSRDMFKDGNTNLIYCFNESRAESIKQRLSVLGTSNDCTNLCFKNSNNKVIKGQSICVEECNIKNYLYEYNNICYESCPEGTFISSKNNYLCINNDLIEESITHIESTNIKTETTNSNEVSQYICDIKCLNCSLDSNKYKLCISCNENEGFYPRLNDSKNINSFLECYNNIEGYYLDYNIFMYKQCFPSCKKCINEGDIYNNNCSECYSNYILINTNCYQKCPYFYYFNSSNNYVCTTKYECPTDYKYLIRDKNQYIDNCTKAKLYHYEINICEEFNHINYTTKDVLQECNFE